MGNYLITAGDFRAIDPVTGDLILTSPFLTESSITIGASKEEIRGGIGNMLIGNYNHSTQFGLTATSPVFSLEYLALSVDGKISVGSNVLTSEEVTITVANQIKVSQTPQVMTGGLGTIGWYKLPDEDINAWKKITFVGDIANVSNLKENQKVCVRYLARNEGARQFTVSSNFVPKICQVILTFPIYASGADKSVSMSSKIGHYEVVIPKFQFDVAQELSLTSSSTASVSLSGTALASFADGAMGCNNIGNYATIKEVIYGTDGLENATSIVVANTEDFELSANEKATIDVRALFNGGMTVPKKLANEDLTFSVNTGTSATVDNKGMVSASASETGDTIIDVAVTKKPTLATKLVVTVGK